MSLTELPTTYPRPRSRRPHPEDGAADDDLARSSTQFLREAASTLGDFRWSIVQLVYADHLTQSEIADRLHISRELVRTEVAQSLRIIGAAMGTGR